MKMKKRPLNTPSMLRIAMMSSAALIVPTQAGAAALAISQVPLYLGGTVAPNIMFILDDSGSMDRSYLPDTINNDWWRNRGRSSTWNKAYYNPNVNYRPPLDQDGNSLKNASFIDAWFDGYAANDSDPKTTTGTTNLGKDYRATWDNNFVESLENRGRAYYYVFDSGNANCEVSNDNCYTKRNVTNTSGPGGTDETTNFANWYSYYRTRMMAAKAGVSRAFAVQGTGMRVGYGRINNWSSKTDDVTGSTLVRGVRDFIDKRNDQGTIVATDRSDFFNWLFKQDGSGNTPSRRALDAAGQYFERVDDKGPWSTTPGESDGKQLSCRQNFTILTTDGHWNDAQAATDAARENNDNAPGDEILGPDGKTGRFPAGAPFADDWKGTLADVAAYYWKRDLRPKTANNAGLTNNVPSSKDDPAFWQHMVTFGVGLGVVGTIPPEEAFAAIDTGTEINWSNPFNSNAAKIDDLLHAAVNSRGAFFSAADPEEFAKALADTLAKINERTSSAATVASNSTRLSTETLLFQAGFNSADWSGDVSAFEIDQRLENPIGTPNPDYGKPKPSPKWNASAQIPAPADRKLFSFDSATGAGVSFTWNGLTTAQKTALSNDRNLLDWLRGDRSKEITQTNGIYRDRGKNIMGDVVNSDPVAVGQEDYNYALASSLPPAERTAYAARRASTAFKNRQSALFFGANDGIFRGIASKTGEELFGFIPNSILPRLTDLADPKYQHRYYVDGAPRVADAFIGNKWKTVLVSSTGAGGSAYFALDVEDADNFGASNVMWEISNARPGYSELGTALGQAAIVRTESEDWVAIIGNGYNAPSGQARLFVVNLETGNVIKELSTGVGSKELPNGLATPIAVDANRNGSIDLVYAGDLYGNMWKFDFTSTDKNEWKIAFGGKPLFKATDKSGNPQPITSKPQVGTHPKGGLMLYFGTGKYFETGDNTDTTVQSLYGVRDECGLSVSSCTASDTAKVMRSNLLKQTIDFEGSHTFGSSQWEIRQFSQNTGTSDQRGFFVDLVYGTNAKGERILATPLLWADRVIYVSATPDQDVCAGGGESWIIELDPGTGGRTTFHPFDLAGDGTYGSKNERNNLPANARKVLGGMIKNLGQIRDSGGKTHKYGSTSNRTIDTSTQQNDGSRRISWRQIQ